ncbi:MAG: response regulator, partial [Anaerolineales bacterium]|nr:response regulator [Anaerolineales bacterium]
MDEKTNILIVDDDESTRRSLKLIFEKRGYETDEAGTGREAIEKTQVADFDVALIDIKLPDMGGVNLIRPLKEKRPDLAAIMVTGFASLETAVQALDEGASAYITKPLNMDEVLARVRGVVEKKHLVIENRRLYQAAQRELTERKRAEEALLASNRQLEEALVELQTAQQQVLASERLTAVGQMAAGIAHDFNNILGAILLLGKLQLKAGEHTPRERDRLLKICEQAKRGASLISQILDFSRRSIMEKQPIDLSSFLGEVGKLLSRTLPENIKLESTFVAEDRFVVNADPTRLEQVFMNLSFNAR